MFEKLFITITCLIMSAMMLSLISYKTPNHPQDITVYSESGQIMKTYNNITDAKFYGGALHFTDNDGCTVTVHTRYAIK